MTGSAGIHHVTAICSNPRRNVAFYTDALGLRMVKKTVNFDDPSSWHLYYGDEIAMSGGSDPDPYFMTFGSATTDSGAGVTVRFAPLKTIA